MIEAWGRGFDKIREACAQYNNAPLPEYNISKTGIMVLCKPSERYLRLLNNGDLVTVDERTWLNMVEALSELDKKNMSAILDYLMVSDTIDNAKGCELTGKSATTMRRYFKRLCEVGILEQTGSTSNTIYRKRLNMVERG